MNQLNPDYLQPMSVQHGIGFTGKEPLPDRLVSGYRYEQVGRYHNYHVTKDRWCWPVGYTPNNERIVIDAFSPNLNKELHIGHLRNLAIASSLQKLMVDQSNTKFVALLGASLGVTENGLRGWEKWLSWTGYSPDVYYDCALPQDVVKCRQDVNPATGFSSKDGEFVPSTPWIWDGPEGEVIVKRSDGKPLYAYHDLAFAYWVNPTHYVTGQEQREHFKSLGFADKHLSMGLVLGDDGKKLKSRDGNAMPINDALGAVMERLNDTPNPGQLAWNILVWNMLASKRERDVKFQVESWTDPTSPGMYISYTYSRVRAAMARAMTNCHLSKYITIVAPSGPDSTMMEQEISDLDLQLLGLSEQYLWHRQMAVEKFDPCPLAQFAMTLAMLLSSAYEKEQIKGGRPSFAAAIGHALWRLDLCMSDLGMFRLETV